ncbi:MAG: S49 family peptidase [Vicinamibacteria bacterium]|nr:S49 family peptidase [Vicinamibacteria bacterium]
MSRRLSTVLNESLWLVTEERYAVIRGVIEGIERGSVVLDADAERIEEPAAHTVSAGSPNSRRKYDMAGAEPGARGAAAEKRTLIVPFHGTIYPRTGGMSPASGGTNMQQTMALIRRAVADPGISSIIGDFDSPGGMVAGVPEAAAEIRSLRGIKPMTAVASFQMASAAYYLGSQFDEIVASPSSSVGSIGVVAMYSSAAKALENEGMVVQMLKYPEYKAEADGVNPLTDEAFAFRMTQIRKTYDAFEAAVAAGLRIDRKVVAEKFGRGRSLDAQQAVKVGAAHRLGTFDDVLLEHLSGRISKQRAFRLSQGRVGMLDELPVLSGDARLALNRTADAVEAARKAEIAAQRIAHAKRWGFAN